MHGRTERTRTRHSRACPVLVVQQRNKNLSRIKIYRHCISAERHACLLAGGNLHTTGSELRLRNRRPTMPQIAGKAATSTSINRHPPQRSAITFIAISQRCFQRVPVQARDRIFSAKSLILCLPSCKRYSYPISIMSLLDFSLTHRALDQATSLR